MFENDFTLYSSMNATNENDSLQLNFSSPLETRKTIDIIFSCFHSPEKWENITDQKRNDLNDKFNTILLRESINLSIILIKAI